MVASMEVDSMAEKVAEMFKTKSDDTAHEETNYIKVQHIQFSLCLSDYSENAHDCENPKKH